MKIVKKIPGLICIALVMLFTAAVPASASDNYTVPSYLKKGVIAHACGGIDGFTYTNSLEALQQTLAKKAKSVEIDFSFTSDGVLVCTHGWKESGNKALKWSKFKKKGTPGGFTAMKAEKALKMLIQAKSTWLVPDIKTKDVAGAYREIVRLVRKNGGEKYLKKIVPQIYSKTQYKQIKKIYPFKQWIFTVYRLKPKTLKEYRTIAAFCSKNGIQVITIPKALLTKEIAEVIHEKGLSVAVHTINSEKKRDVLFAMGADAIYTDFLY